jgi:hypothetical protein
MTTFFNVFFSPGAAFRKVKEKPVWIGAFIVVLVVGMLMSLVAINKVSPNMWRDRAEEAMRKQGLSEEQVEQRLAESEKFMNNPVMKYGLPLVSTPMNLGIALVAIAAVTLGVVWLCGAKPNFLLSLAVVSYASLIGALDAAVRMTIILLRGDLRVVTGLALFAPEMKPGYLFTLLNRIELFGIWQVIAIAMGLKVVYELKDRRSYYYMFGVWIVFVALSSLIPGFGGQR